MIASVLDPETRRRLEAANSRMRTAIDDYRVELLLVFGETSVIQQAADALRCVATENTQALYSDDFPLSGDTRWRFFRRVSAWHRQAIKVPPPPNVNSDPRVARLRDRLAEDVEDRWPE